MHNPGQISAQKLHVKIKQRNKQPLPTNKTHKQKKPENTKNPPTNQPHFSINEEGHFCVL